MSSTRYSVRVTTGLAVLVSALWLAPAFASDDGYSAYADLPPGVADAEVLPVGDSLKPGEFEWMPGAKDAAPGQVMVVVSLSDQRAYVYRNGERIGVSTASTGKPGMETPTGVFPILQKRKVHFSNLYDNAPMPFMQRLTWDGVALHAGRIPGKPASHGCVRLPKQFAEDLFAMTRHGQTVVVSQDGSVASLARAGLSQHLALLVGTTSTFREIADMVDSQTFGPQVPQVGGGSGSESLANQ